MTREELEAELAKVRAQLAGLKPGDPLYVTGKIIEEAILHSLGVKE